MSKIICECCQKTEAVFKDFRQQYEACGLDKFFVCKKCLTRSDKSFFAQIRANAKKGADHEKAQAKTDGLFGSSQG